MGTVCTELALVQVHHVSSLYTSPPWLLPAPHHPLQPKAHARARAHARVKGPARARARARAYARATVQWHGWWLPGRSVGWCYARNKGLWPDGGRATSWWPNSLVRHQTLRWHEGIRATKWWPTSLVGHQTLKWHGQGRLGPPRGGPSIPTYGIRI